MFPISKLLYFLLTYKTVSDAIITVTLYLPILHWNIINFAPPFRLLRGPIRVYAELIFYHWPVLHWSSICSLHVSGPVYSPIPTKQQELILNQCWEIEG